MCISRRPQGIEIKHNSAKRDDNDSASFEAVEDEEGTLLAKDKSDKVLVVDGCRFGG